MQKPTPNNYKYLSLASEMLATFLVAYFAGNWLDKKDTRKIPLFTLIFLSIAIIVVLVRVIKDSKTTKK